MQPNLGRHAPPPSAADADGATAFVPAAAGTADGDAIAIESGTLVVLVGAAGAGKTTFAARWFAPTERLSSDGFRAMLLDDEADQRANADVFGMLHLAAAARLRRGRTTVIDATNLRHDARRDLVQVARGARRPVVAVVLDLPEADCQERNGRRPARSVPPEVVARHARELRRMMDAGSLGREGFDAVFVLRSPAEVDAASVVRVPPPRPSAATARSGRREGVEPTAAPAEEGLQRPAAASAVGPRTDRTRIRRHPERAVPERIDEILRAGRVAHVAHIAGGEPRVIPLLYGYGAGRIVLHGAPGSSTLRRLRDGARVAVSVTLLDGLVASRDAANHSANYRSVVAYGTTRRVTDDAEKRRLLEAMTDRYFPGRTAGVDYTPATESDLRSMEVVEVVIEEANAKTRSGPPLGRRDADPDAPGSAGVVSPA